jgi:hypothetical protein
LNIKSLPLRSWPREFGRVRPLLKFAAQAAGSADLGRFDPRPAGIRPGIPAPARRYVWSMSNM